ncbi:MAG: hypothetical protein QOK43_2210 [Acidimicrobiaceae bacterium]|nr:hypothetical protein [Acidimicrobiaceae bacterium]
MAAPDPVSAFRDLVEEALERNGLFKTALADELHISDSMLNAMFKGTSLTMTLEMLKRFSVIEAKLGLPHGEIVRVMGFAKTPESVREGIRSEAGLSLEGKEAVLVLFDHYRRKAKARRLRPVDAERVEREAASGGKTAPLTPGQVAEIEASGHHISPGADDGGDVKARPK